MGFFRSQNIFLRLAAQHNFFLRDIIFFYKINIFFKAQSTNRDRHFFQSNLPTEMFFPKKSKVSKKWYKMTFTSQVCMRVKVVHETICIKTHRTIILFSGQQTLSRLSETALLGKLPNTVFFVITTNLSVDISRLQSIPKMRYKVSLQVLIQLIQTVYEVWTYICIFPNALINYSLILSLLYTLPIMLIIFSNCFELAWFM